MTTLVRAGRHRCDATCHNAGGRACRCICGGVLHGKREGAIALLAGLEVRLPAGVQGATIHLPALPPAEEEKLEPFDRYVTLTIRWREGPEPEVMGGGLMLASQDVAALFGVLEIDGRIAPWLELPEADRANIERALVDTGKDAASWWTAKFLQLCAKSDASHLEALRAAAPNHVAAYEAWRMHEISKGPERPDAPDRRDGDNFPAAEDTSNG